MLRARLVLAVATVSTLPLGACSDDDDTAGGTTIPPSSVPITGGPPGATTAPAVIPSSTLPPPVDLAALSAALLGAGDVGVPDTWAIRDLDPAIMDDELTIDADPFQGFLSCGDVSLRPEGSWLQRTFSAPEQPLDNGLLRVDLIVAAQDAAASAAEQAGLASCTTTSPDAGVEVTAVEVTPLDGATGTATGAPVGGTMIALTAGPSASVPYPSAYTGVIANVDGRTVTAVVGGIDAGVPFADSTRELVGRLLSRL